MSQVVLVTGASRGIGRAIAQGFIDNGARVAATARSLEALGELMRAHPDRCRAARMDVRDRGEVDRVVADIAREFGRIDAVVNNAGVSGATPIDAPDDTVWHQILATTLDGAMFVVRAALPHLPRGGRVVNVSSALGKFGAARKGAYCAAKHGLVGWTRALALELAPRGITVNAVCPGWVDTEMAAASVREQAAALGQTPAQFRRDAEARVPIGRFLQPREVAEFVRWLCSPAADAVTGQALSIDGGQTPF